MDDSQVTFNNKKKSQTEKERVLSQLAFKHWFSYSSFCEALTPTAQLRCWHLVLFPPYLSTSPKTISWVVTTSSGMWCLDIESTPCEWAEPGNWRLCGPMRPILLKILSFLFFFICFFFPIGKRSHPKSSVNEAPVVDHEDYKWVVFSLENLLLRMIPF